MNATLKLLNDAANQLAQLAMINGDHTTLDLVQRIRKHLERK